METWHNSVIKDFTNSGEGDISLWMPAWWAPQLQFSWEKDNETNTVLQQQLNTSLSLTLLQREWGTQQGLRICLENTTQKVEFPSFYIDLAGTFVSSLFNLKLKLECQNQW